MIADRRRLPKKRRHTTYKAKIGGQKIWVTLGKYEDGTLGEVFIDMAKAGSFVRGMMNCFARLFSFALQYGVPVPVLLASFRGIDFEPRGDVVGCDGISSAESVIDYIAQLIEKDYAERPKSNYNSLECCIGGSDCAPIDSSGTAQNSKEHPGP